MRSIYSVFHLLFNYDHCRSLLRNCTLMQVLAQARAKWLRIFLLTNVNALELWCISD